MYRFILSHFVVISDLNCPYQLPHLLIVYFEVFLKMDKRNPNHYFALEISIVIFSASPLNDTNMLLKQIYIHVVVHYQGTCLSKKLSTSTAFLILSQLLRYLQTGQKKTQQLLCPGSGLLSCSASLVNCTSPLLLCQ